MSSHCSGGSCGSHQKPQDEREIRVKEALSRVKNKILVMSGKGGVGKSTVATNMAVTLAKRGHKVGLMDVDLHGPSIPYLLGVADQKPDSDGSHFYPLPVMENLKMISMANFLPNKDDAVIWRGPMKITAIRQFVGDAAWGDLDYLVIDSPPGTGDEPLTVAQDIEGARAVVVTTPQEISLADVRKSINFCKNVAMPVVGIVENMSGYVCPKCGNVEDLFGKGGGEKTAEAMGTPYLGAIPIDPMVVVAGDAGKPFMNLDEDSPTIKAYNGIVDKLEAFVASFTPPNEMQADQDYEVPVGEDGCTKIAIPTAEEKLCPHFGHCEQFTVFTVRENKIIDKSFVVPPPHEPGLLPKWLSERGIKLVIAGGMGQRAQDFFNQFGIKVVVGAPPEAPEAVLESYLAGNLTVGENVCDH